MLLQEKIEEDIKTSMRSGDKERTNILRLLISSIKNEKIKKREDLTDEETMKVLQREAKQRKDSMASYAAADRPELVSIEENELKLIATYLPVELSDSEIIKIVDETLNEMSDPSIDDMGRIIGLVIKKLGAQADGSKVSRIVREKLI
jgi:uncharacterized protein YqeY